ncbi:response regulator [uncultured Hymenobacter sp.]|uniref:response regulator n=1 Tax=uncultured Hymenobacter sp. TaxID=170016 RepID=UPI0035C9C557
MTRLLLADDHAIIRDGIRALLSAEEDLLIAGEAGNGAELLTLLETTPADVVLMDVNMPVLDGYATMQELRQRYPALRVLVLSMLDHENYVARMLDAGAAGYILKNSSIAEIAFAIRMVATGQRFLCSEIGFNLLYKLTSSPLQPEKNAPTLPPGVELTGRELEVLRLIAEGFTNQEIADKLFTSKRTIETHRQNIITKTQARNTAALIKLALDWRLIK